MHTEVGCQWFALCRNPATGVLRHPVLHYVPACERCACKAEDTLIPGTFTETEQGYDFRPQEGVTL